MLYVVLLPLLKASCSFCLTCCSYAVSGTRAELRCLLPRRGRRSADATLAKSGAEVVLESSGADEFEDELSDSLEDGLEGGLNSKSGFFSPIEPSSDSEVDPSDCWLDVLDFFRRCPCCGASAQGFTDCESTDI